MRDGAGQRRYTYNIPHNAQTDRTNNTKGPFRTLGAPGSGRARGLCDRLHTLTRAHFTPSYQTTKPPASYQHTRLILPALGLRVGLGLTLALPPPTRTSSSSSSGNGRAARSGSDDELGRSARALARLAHTPRRPCHLPRLGALGAAHAHPHPHAPFSPLRKSCAARRT
jgi:hypothetical protein